MNRIARMLVLPALVLAVQHPASAAAMGFDTDFVVTLRGFTIGRASFTGTIEGDHYEVNGKLASAGLARIFARTDATSTSIGEISTGAVEPESFLLNYAQDDWSSKTAIAFRNGNAVTTQIEPKPEPPGDKVIPITGADLKSVADPVSATLFARGSPEQICGRTLRIYEGGTRIDVQLSLKATGFVYGAGNHAVTCHGNFVPVAGMDRGNETYEYLRAKADMEFVYVPAASGGLYMLHSLSTRTDIGTVRVKSWRRHVSG
jgi:hypothetical protein